MTCRPPRRNPGFTLIELLAASALAALLMLVMFQVLASLGRSRAALERAAASETRSATQTAWKSDLLDLIRWDLTNADDVSFKPGLLTLSGHAAIDRQSLAAKQEPVTVVYRIERRSTLASNDAGCLVRRQLKRDGLSDDGAWSELVCANVKAFEVTPVPNGRNPSASTRVRIEGATGLVMDEVIVVK